MRVFHEWGGLWRTGSTSYRSLPELFPELDLDLMTRHMKLVELATKRGRLNDPATNSSSFDEVERRIISEIENQKRQVFDKVTAQLQAIRERIGTLQLDSLIARVGVTIDAA